MKFIFLLIVLFVLVCVFYGIYAGVSAIGRIGARIGDQEQEQEQEQESMPYSLPNSADIPPKISQDYVTELQALFALHQSGALTAQEFESLKQRLLNSLNTATPQNH